MQDIVGASLSKHHVCACMYLHIHVYVCVSKGTGLRMAENCMFMMNKESFWWEAILMNIVAITVCNLLNILLHS